MKIRDYLIICTIAVSLIAGFIGGYKMYPSIHPCPTVTSDTVFVHDTTVYTIVDSIPYPVRDTIFFPDTVTIPTDVDTNAILQDYYAVYGYPWEKADSNIKFNLYTTITQNKPIRYSFSYELLKPQEVVYNNIDNSITYNRYLYAGAGISTYEPNISLNLLYASDKSYFKVGYTPKTKGIELGAGIKLLKFKQIK